eukprot:3123681-Rhodomonas_salina.1
MSVYSRGQPFAVCAASVQERWVEAWRQRGRQHAGTDTDTRIHRQCGCTNAAHAATPICKGYGMSGTDVAHAAVRIQVSGTGHRPPPL